jgi:cell surface protein SprA
LKSSFKYCLIIWWIQFTFFGFGQNTNQNIVKDSIVSDSSQKVTLPYTIKSLDLDNFFFKRPQYLFLKDPENIKSSFSYHPKSNTYILNRKIGKFDYRIPTILSFSEYQKYATKKSKNDFWKSNLKPFSGRGKRGIIPSMYVKGNVFENIFGSNFIDIRPQGSAEISFGFLSNNRKDETLDVNRRKTTSFDFNEKIQMSVTAKIGEKIEFKTNYNTESTFDFDNNLALKYVGNEDEIIQLIEGGDVNFTLPTTLINGSQGLFGVKTKLRFGRTTITGVFSQQKSETASITVQGGAQKNNFELTALDYEENRHFFFGQYFREDVMGADGKPSNRYNEALRTLPIVTSNINITRIEVWVTNIGAALTENRNIVAFADLGEGNPYQSSINKTSFTNLPSNETNDLLSRLDESKIRNINMVTQYLQNDPLGVGGFGYFVAGEDFEKIESARKLNPSEYTFNSKLGFISLNSRLNSDQTLAVAYQYTVLGDNKVYQVGEFSDQEISAPKNLIVKLLKSTSVNTNNPLWDLMMKNVYSIKAYQVNPEDFIFNVLYSGNKNGIPTAYFTEGNSSIKGVPIIRLLGMDRLDQRLNPPGDGVFDFIDGAATQGGIINASNGRIFFPVLEPFGKDLRKLFTDSNIAEKYAYDSLYTLTKSGAEQYPEKNKFILEGFFKSASNNEISLNAFNVPQGSVKVVAGGITLSENIDYTVDYTLGRVRIINEGILNSGTPIKISRESNSMFNIQTKRYMGVHIDHELNDKTNFGATIINLNERPLTQKTNYGEDPISNTIWGFNFNYEEKSRLLTKLVDKIPFIETNVPSIINVEGEFAQFMPGHSAVVGETGISYIDDFEGSKSTIDLKYFSTWMLASTPQGQYDLFPEAAPNTGLDYGKNRARLAWYIIDPLFYDRNTNLKPKNITAEELSKHTVRQVLETEVFPNKDIPNGIPTNISVLNMAFYPKEKGPYNYDVEAISNITDGINSEGFLNNPESRWGGMMRKIESTDFEAANVEYIEFWMMDPFTENPLNKGKLYFNLGDISEDILRDSRKSFENGLPISDEILNVDTTIWGRVPKIQTLVESFENTSGARKYQDLGYDGLSTEDEISFFGSSGVHNYLDKIKDAFGDGSIAYQNALTDPASDNYHYFRGTDFDENNKYSSVLARYKLFNNPEGNSPTNDMNHESYPTSATALPNIEDINRDNTLSEAERYFQYEIDLDPSKMYVGQNYITDVFEATTHQLPDGSVKTVKWYQFKIPVNSPDLVVGNIEDFKSIRFLRTFMRGFSNPVVLRFATLELVRGEWRRYRQSLLQPDQQIPANAKETSFDISAVNIEENGRKIPIPYVIPPGIDRETNIATTNIVRRNEQSMVLKVTNLVDGDSRGAFKTTSFDFRQYKELKMYVHAEKVNESEDVEDGDLTLFIRMGSDFNENYYEYEVPLKLTPWETTSAQPDEIWPEANTFIINLKDLVKIKLNRNIAMREANSSVTTNSPYIVSQKNHTVTVLGVPSISDVRALLIGIRNPKQKSFITTTDDGSPKSVEVWVNELRLSDYRSSGGWAARARLSTNLADLGRVTVSGSHSTHGFGGVEQKVNETQKEKISNFDLSMDIEFGKFFSEKSGIKIPVHFDYSSSTITPEFNPLNPDIKLEDELNSFESQREKDSLNKIVQDYVYRKNINFINVHKERTGIKKRKIYDIENFNFSYAYSEIFSRNIDIEQDMRKTYRGGFTYNYRHNPKPIKPFNKIGFLSKSPYLKIFKDFNFYIAPKVLYFSTDMYREHNKRKLRNKSSRDVPIETFYAKKWDWNRDYNIKYDLTQSINIDFKAHATAYIDETQGNPDKGTPEYDAYQDEVWNEIKEFGTISKYNQSITINYNLPINKIPLFSWVNSQFKYLGTYNWSASPKSTQQRFGNQIENSRQIQLNGSLNFTQLYNKISYLRSLSQQNRKRRLGIKNPSHRSLLPENKDEKSPKKKLRNKATKLVLNTALNLLTAIKRASFTYSKTEGIFLPGFLPQPSILGNARNYTPDPEIFNNSPYFGSNYPTSLAPGIGFVFGDQRDIRNEAIRNGWLSPDTLLNQAYATKQTTNFSARISLEPFPDFKIELTADRVYSLNHREVYRANSSGFFDSYAPVDQGSFSMSFVALGTAFKSDIGDMSVTFENMKNNRLAIAERLAQNNPNWNGEYFPVDTIIVDGQQQIIMYPVGYGPSSQDVLMYSFLSAYSGKSIQSAKLNIFPKIPLPNWRLTYSGLTRIEFLRNIFRNITISHAYRASYNIGNFVSNVDRQLINGFPAALYTNGNNYIPEYDITMISITEQFIPLISIDVVMKNNLSAKIEMKKSRNISFSFANNQLTEVKNDEIVVGLGYRIKDLNLGFKTMSGNNGRTKNVKSDLNIKADFSLRQNKTSLRRIDELINQISAGQEIISINLSADYLVSRKFNIRMYYDKVINNPFVSSQYPSSTTTGGFSLRFFLN